MQCLPPETIYPSPKPAFWAIETALASLLDAFWDHGNPHGVRKALELLHTPTPSDSRKTKLGGRNQDSFHPDLAAGSNEHHLQRTLSVVPGSQKWTRIHASRISDRILRIGCVTVDPPQPAQVDRHLWISMPGMLSNAFLLLLH